MSSLIGETVSRYHVLEQLGAGGMGVVYLARDERLNREVALKMLPADTLGDEGARRRFQREALSLAQLSHPNIAAIYDFDTEDGRDFLVMEYVRGVALNASSRARRGDHEVSELGAQLADGLVAAHNRGVIHRDIKPANLILTPDGQLKILDFGVAKLMPASNQAPADATTETNAVSGTPPYMALEQLRGEELDSRTDLWAAGAVLYELATGERPFQGSGASLSDAILHQTPESPRARNRTVSVTLDAIIVKCLQKEPDARYQTAQELRADLRHILAGTAIAPSTRPSCTSIAVLPLANHSSPDNEYFADGMSEALIAELMQIRSLHVVSRTSSMRYKGSEKTLPEIARELGVDTVLEGSVQRSTDRVRITAQLIHAATDQHLWAKTYDREIREVLLLQSEVAADIAREIGGQVASKRADRSSVNPEAYDAYLRGNFHSSMWQLDKAQEAYEKAIAADPDFPDSYARLSACFYFLAFLGVMSPQAAFAKVRSLSATSLELKPELVEGLGQRGLLSLHYDWDWFACERDFRRALEIDPSFADNHHYYAHFLLAMNRPLDNLEEMRKAVASDPQNPVLRVCNGWHRLFSGEYNSAVEDADRGVEMAGNLFWGPIVRGLAFEQLGKLAEAVAEFDEAVSQSGGLSIAVSARAHALALLGEKAQAEAGARELIEKSQTAYVSAFEIAVVFAGLGDLDRTFEWLQNAVRERSTWLVHLGWDPRFRPIRSDPRFAQIIRAIGLPMHSGRASSGSQSKG